MRILWLTLLLGSLILAEEQYFLNSSAKTWDEARDHCQACYKDLATITCRNIHLILQNLTSEYWIGLRRRFNGSIPWSRWSNGDHVTYQNWYPGHPILKEETCSTTPTSTLNIVLTSNSPVTVLTSIPGNNSTSTPVTNSTSTPVTNLNSTSSMTAPNSATPVTDSTSTTLMSSTTSPISSTEDQCPLLTQMLNCLNMSYCINKTGTTGSTTPPPLYQTLLPVNITTQTICDDNADLDPERYIEDACVALLSYGMWIEKHCNENLSYICYDERFMGEIHISNVNENGANLSWSPAPGNITHYTVVVKADQNLTLNVTETGLSKHLLNLEESTRYDVQVFPLKCDRDLNPQNISFYTTPSAVYNLNVTKVTNESIELSWDHSGKPDLYSVKVSYVNWISTPPVIDSTSTTPVTNSTSITPVTNSTSITLVTNSTSITPVTNSTSITPVTNSTSITPVTNSTSITPVTNSTSITPVTNSTSITPVTDSTSIIPVTNSSSITPVTDLTSITPVTDSTSITPVTNSTSITPVTNSTSITPVTDSTSTTPETVSEIHNATEKKIVISGLRPAKMYNLTVTAIVNGTTESVPESVSTYTKPSRVLNLKSADNNDAVIYAAWTKPDETLSGYRVCLNENNIFCNNCSDCNECIECVNCTITTAERINFTNKTSGTKYILCVAALTNNNETQGEMVQIAAYTRPKAVTELKLTATFQSITANWNLTEGYKIFNVSIKADGWVGTSKVTDKLYHTFEDLQAAVNYTITVITLSEKYKLESDPAEQSVYTKIIPPGNATAIVLNQTAIKLTWEVPKELTGNSTITYKVTAHSNYWNETHKKNVTQNTFIFNDLKSGTNYNFRVSVVAGNDESDPVFAYNMTVPYKKKVTFAVMCTSETSLYCSENTTLAEIKEELEKKFGKEYKDVHWKLKEIDRK
nr:uncharacterized protein LOC129422849 [Misgurnus anguillicaudatus]